MNVADTVAAYLQQHETKDSETADDDTHGASFGGPDRSSMRRGMRRDVGAEPKPVVPCCQARACVLSRSLSTREVLCVALVVDAEVLVNLAAR